MVAKQGSIKQLPTLAQPSTKLTRSMSKMPKCTIPTYTEISVQNDRTQQAKIYRTMSPKQFSEGKPTTPMWVWYKLNFICFSCSQTMSCCIRETAARKQRESLHTCPPTRLATLYAFHVCSPAMHDSSKETATQNPELKRKRRKGKQRENQCPIQSYFIFSRGETGKEKSKSTKRLARKM